ncbi:LOW QUALITY PROTEIN: hypothetical protein DH2020_024447 [Rehmannia glutinosa]|uniref:Uncharacterized protein n=1 Tax=Rehmannia glutinosa TaxID=99300 RepID=A0ABR0W647_REHGL
MSKEAEAILLDENLLYEVLRHVDDGRTLAKAACPAVEADGTQRATLGADPHETLPPQLMRLRAIVLALGGFRRLYSSHLRPAEACCSFFFKPRCPAVSAWPCLPRLGKIAARFDEI